MRFSLAPRGSIGSLLENTLSHPQSIKQKRTKPFASIGHLLCRLQTPQTTCMFLLPLLLPLLSLLPRTTSALPPKQQPFMTSYSPAAITERDLASYSNSREVRSNAIHLDWSIDWSAQTVGGSVTHEMVVLERGDIEEVVLDTRDLEISKVEVEGKELKVRLALRFALPDSR
jgi:hypothetical protein